MKRSSKYMHFYRCFLYSPFLVLTAFINSELLHSNEENKKITKYRSTEAEYVKYEEYIGAETFQSKITICSALYARNIYQNACHELPNVVQIRNKCYTCHMLKEIK